MAGEVGEPEPQGDVNILHGDEGARAKADFEAARAVEATSRETVQAARATEAVLPTFAPETTTVDNRVAEAREAVHEAHVPKHRGEGKVIRKLRDISGGDHRTHQTTPADVIPEESDVKIIPRPTATLIETPAVPDEAKAAEATPPLFKKPIIDKEAWHAARAAAEAEAEAEALAEEQVRNPSAQSTQSPSPDETSSDPTELKIGKIHYERDGGDGRVKDETYKIRSAEEAHAMAIPENASEDRLKEAADKLADQRKVAEALAARGLGDVYTTQTDLSAETANEHKVVAKAQRAASKEYRQGLKGLFDAYGEGAVVRISKPADMTYLEDFRHGLEVEATPFKVEKAGDAELHYYVSSTQSKLLFVEKLDHHSGLRLEIQALRVASPVEIKHRYYTDKEVAEASDTDAPLHNSWVARLRHRLRRPENVAELSPEAQLAVAAQGLTEPYLPDPAERRHNKTTTTFQGGNVAEWSMQQRGASLRELEDYRRKRKTQGGWWVKFFGG